MILKRGHLTNKSDDRVHGAFEHHFGPRDGNLNDPIFKGSNTPGLPKKHKSKNNEKIKAFNARKAQIVRHNSSAT